MNSNFFKPLIGILIAALALIGCSGGGGGGGGGGSNSTTQFQTDVAVIQSATTGDLVISVSLVSGMSSESINTTVYEVTKETPSGPQTFTVQGSGVGAIVRYLGSTDLDDASRVTVTARSFSSLGATAISSFSIQVARTPVLELTSTFRDHPLVTGALQLSIIRTDRAHSVGDLPEVVIKAETLDANGRVDRELFDSVIGSGGITAPAAIDTREVRVRLTMSGPTTKVLEFDVVRGGRTDMVFLR